MCDEEAATKIRNQRYDIYRDSSKRGFRQAMVVDTCCAIWMLYEMQPVCARAPFCLELKIQTKKEQAQGRHSSAGASVCRSSW